MPPPPVFVDMNDCQSAKYDETLETSGLDTCIGIVAFGFPQQQGGINKVMAHCSPFRVKEILRDLFVSQVSQSRMEIYGICMSCPEPDRNDHGPGKISDQQIKQILVREYGYEEKEITSKMIKEFRDGLRKRLIEAREFAWKICTEELRTGPAVYTRRNSDVEKPYPYGALIATASPRGQVIADEYKMTRIPNWGEQAFSHAPVPASAPGYGKSYGGRHHNSYGTSSSSKSAGSTGHASGSSKVSSSSSSRRRGADGHGSSSSRNTGSSHSSRREDTEHRARSSSKHTSTSSFSRKEDTGRHSSSSSKHTSYSSSSSKKKDSDRHASSSSGKHSTGNSSSSQRKSSSTKHHCG